MFVGINNLVRVVMQEQLGAANSGGEERRRMDELREEMGLRKSFANGGKPA